MGSLSNTDWQGADFDQRGAEPWVAAASGADLVTGLLTGGSADETPLDTSAAVVRVSVLRLFDELVTQLGGDYRGLLAKLQIEPTALESRHAVLPYRTLVHLLERASIELSCPDFGMRLACLQGKGATLGPLYVAMRNSPTLGDAFRYCVEHGQAYSSGTKLFVEENHAADEVVLRFEIVLSRLPYQRQSLEHSLALMCQNVHNLSSGRVAPRSVWLTHPPLAPLASYRAHFGCPVHFGRNLNAVLLSPADLLLPLDSVDPWLFELATNFIEQRYPISEPPLSMRVRGLVERKLLEGDCTFVAVAAMLGMHPRTLQRRLRAENESFETIKDSVRRDVALRYLCQSDLPLTRIAEMLGYSETSVLSRSCLRWFAASPRQLRNGRLEGVFA